jgi:hypothetical protein
LRRISPIFVDSVRLKRAQNPGSLEREPFDEEHPHRTALRQLEPQLLSHRVTWDVKRSSRFKRKPRNYRSGGAQTRYYVSTKRFSGRRTFNLRSSCIDRKNTAFCHLEGFRPSDSLYFPSQSMPFGQILRFQGSYDACLSSFAKFLESISFRIVNRTA